MTDPRGPQYFPKRGPSTPTDAVKEALRLYLAEYGGDGYDATTFVDFVVTAVHAPGDAFDLVQFYRDRANELLDNMPKELKPCHRCGIAGATNEKPHRCPHGIPCRLDFIPATGREEQVCGLCAVGVKEPPPER